MQITNSAVQLTGFNPVLGTPSYTYEGSTTYERNGRVVTVYELLVDTGPRIKRCLVLAPPIPKMIRPILGIGFPASNGIGDGALDIVAGIDSTAIAQQWDFVTRLTADHNIFFVAIDLPLFGPEPSYVSFPSEMQGPLSDNLFAINAARHYIENNLMDQTRYSELNREMFTVGLSWGGYMSMFTACACPDITLSYIASACSSKTHDSRSHFNPPEWSSGYDYDDMITIAASWCKFRWTFGGASDYLYQPFATGNPLNTTKVYDPGGPNERVVVNADYSIAQMELGAGSQFDYELFPSLGHGILRSDLETWLKPYEITSFKRWSNDN